MSDIVATPLEKTALTPAYVFSRIPLFTRLKMYLFGAAPIIKGGITSVPGTGGREYALKLISEFGKRRGFPREIFRSQSGFMGSGHPITYRRPQMMAIPYFEPMRFVENPFIEKMVIRR